jgi:hypothetical protein
MTVDRRSFLRGAGALGGVALAALPPWPAALAALPPLPATPGFAAMSAAFLGVSASEINPSVSQDHYSQADLVFTTAVQGFGLPNVLGLVGTYNGLIASMSPADAAQAMVTGTGLQGCMSRIIYLIYLLGVWYAGTEISHNSGSSGFFPPGLDKDLVVSSRAYKDGWIWRMAQAHPMGFSQFNFGSWGDDPPALSDFGLV